MAEKINWPSLFMTILVITIATLILIFIFIDETNKINKDKKFCEDNNLIFTSRDAKGRYSINCKGLENGGIIYKRFEVYNHERYFLKDG